MHLEVDIGFDQLVKIVKDLPMAKLKLLKVEIEKEVIKENDSPDLEQLLLNGPVATKKQLETIENNRKLINQWRIK